MYEKDDRMEKLKNAYDELSEEEKEIKEEPSYKIRSKKFDGTILKAIHSSEDTGEEDEKRSFEDEIKEKEEEKRLNMELASEAIFGTKDDPNYKSKTYIKQKQVSIASSMETLANYFDDNIMKEFLSNYTSFSKSVDGRGVNMFANMITESERKDQEEEQEKSAIDKLLGGLSK